MITIVIQADEDVASALKEIANKKATSVAAIANEALRDYLRVQSQSRSYSFIGIGRSDKPDLSKQAESLLDEGCNRREGWSQSQ